MYQITPSRAATQHIYLCCLTAAPSKRHVLPTPPLRIGEKKCSVDSVCMRSHSCVDFASSCLWLTAGRDPLVLVHQITGGKRGIFSHSSAWTGHHSVGVSCNQNWSRQIQHSAEAQTRDSRGLGNGGWSMVEWWMVGFGDFGGGGD